MLHGPLFFGAASRLNDALEAAFPAPKAIILRFADVPMIDASGVGTLVRFLKRCDSEGVAVVLSELQPRSREVLAKMAGLKFAHVSVAPTYARAPELAHGEVRAATSPTVEETVTGTSVGKRHMPRPEA